DTTEWANTTITFDIAERDGATEVRFAHHGLVPEYECFRLCSTAWGFFINTSLRELITTGTGRPNSRDRLRSFAEMAPVRGRSIDPLNPRGKVDLMRTPPIVSARDWEAARTDLLVQEKEVSRARDALAARRRRMP